MSAASRFILGFFCCGLLAACVPTAEGRWHEEVELSDGRIITVERLMIWKEMQAWGQSREYGLEESKLELPETARAPSWHATQEYTLILDFDAPRQEYVLVTYPGTCHRYDEAGRPRPPYIEYRLRNGTWTQVPLSSEHIGRRANMLVYPQVSREPVLVTVAMKAQRQAKMSGQEGRLVAKGRMAGCG